MKQGRTLTDLAAEILRREKAKLDLVTPANHVAVGVVDRPVMTVGTDAAHRFGIQPLAHQQLVHYLGLPKPHYDALLSQPDALRVRVAGSGFPGDTSTNINDASLWAVWVNAQLHAKPDSERRMVRTLDGNTRAFLSGRFRPIDHEEVAERIIPILQKYDLDWEHASMEVTDERLYIRVTNPSVKVDLVERARAKAGPGGHGMYSAAELLGRDSDVVTAGVQITNSEVGLGTFAITPLVFRTVCSNGAAIAEEGKRKFHTGGTGGNGGGDDSVWEYLRDDTIVARNNATILEMRDLVEAALGPTLLDRQVDKILRAAGIEVPNPAAAIEVVQKRYSLSDGEKEGVLAYLVKGGDLSLWGLVNGMTGYAQTVESFDRSVELESIGGQMLVLDGADLRALREAHLN